MRNVLQFNSVSDRNYDDGRITVVSKPMRSRGYWMPLAVIEHVEFDRCSE